MSKISKYYWHVSRKGEEPKVIRHYNWLTKMYQFVLRNPAMFKDKTLTIHNWHKPVLDITFEEIKNIVSAGLKEKEARRDLFARANLRE